MHMYMNNALLLIAWANLLQSMRQALCEMEVVLFSVLLLLLLSQFSDLFIVLIQLRKILFILLISVL